jgi:hypothetical protein
VTTNTTEKVVTPLEQGSHPKNIGENVQDDKDGNGGEEHSSKIPPMEKRQGKWSRPWKREITKSLKKKSFHLVEKLQLIL